MKANNIDRRRFRDALGRFATGITVITTRGANGKPEGLTANSFAALSLDPPLVLWCLAKSAPSVSAFEGSAYFAINVLGAGQRELSHRFATPAEDKFAGVAWSKGLGGAPLFEGCLARFECRHDRCLDGGDHLIFVGMVERFAHAGGDPLLFVAGKYGAATGHSDDHGETVASDDFAEFLV